LKNIVFLLGYLACVVSLPKFDQTILTQIKKIKLKNIIIIELLMPQNVTLWLGDQSNDCPLIGGAT